MVAVGITPEGSWVLTDGRPETLAITDGQLPERERRRPAPRWRWPPIPARRGQLLSLGEGAGRDPGLGRRRVPGAARPVRRGRHHPGAARTRRRALRRRRRAGQRGGHGQGVHQEAARRRGAADRRPGGAARPRRDRSTLDDRERLGLPVFVKPARGGSSIGVSRVTAWDELAAAIAYARRHDPKVIVEAAVPGRELECGVLEFPDGRVEASTRRRDPGGRGPRPRGRLLRLRDQVPRRRRRTRRARQGRRRDRRRDAAIGDPGVPRHRLPGSGPRRLLPHRRRPGDQRDQHDARVHHHLDVPADVGGQRRRLPDAAGRRWSRRRSRAAPACASATRARDRAGPAGIACAHRRRRSAGSASAPTRRAASARRRPAGRR